MTPARTRSLRRAALPLVLVVLLAALVPVAVQKRSCIQPQNWPHPPHWCFTEIPHLLFTEQLTGGRVPYLQPCRQVPGVPCDEYPVLTMAAMRVASTISPTPGGFFTASALLLLAAALIAAIALTRLVGLRALYFVAAPTMILYGFMNWDLLAVCAMVGATFWLLRGRRAASGIALGLGAAAKLIPGLLAPLFALGTKSRARRSASRLLVAALLTWLFFNLPLAVAAPHSWWEFFRFNAARPPDVDSLWSMGCQGLFGRDCMDAGLMNALSLFMFIGISAIVWRIRRSRYPDTPPWTMGFALLAIFFLSNKVYSPQYDLFLLPWFALVLPDLRLFLLFEIAGVAVYATRYTGIIDAPIAVLYTSLLARDAVLAACVGAYVLRPLPEGLPEKRLSRADDPPDDAGSRARSSGLR